MSTEKRNAIAIANQQANERKEWPEKLRALVKAFTEGRIDGKVFLDAINEGKKYAGKKALEAEAAKLRDDIERIDSYPHSLPPSMIPKENDVIVTEKIRQEAREALENQLAVCERALEALEGTQGNVNWTAVGRLVVRAFGITKENLPKKRTLFITEMKKCGYDMKGNASMLTHLGLTNERTPP